LALRLSAVSVLEKGRRNRRAYVDPVSNSSAVILGERPATGRNEVAHSKGAE
jgi:hypothetical protein